MRNIILVVSMTFAAAACAPKNFETLQQLSLAASAPIGCSDFQSRSFDAINTQLLNHPEMPSAAQMKDHFSAAVQGLRSGKGPLSASEKNLLSEDLKGLYEIFLTDAVNAENAATHKDLLQVLTALELGDHTTPSKRVLQQKLETAFQKIESDAKMLQVQCAAPPSGQSSEDSGLNPVVGASQLPLPVFGANWTMATAYQDCDSLAEPALDQSSGDIEGISIVGKHSDGVGNRRMISSLSSVLRTHPYYKNVQSYAQSCKDLRKTPLIYDYGGKPFVSSSASTSMDLFKDAGDGTSALGIDCSGYIYTALATAGLRLSPSKNLKAIGVHGISSTMYLDPAQNQMTCLQKITVTATQGLLAGDIAAIPGHVLMVQSVGPDPFGLNHISSASECPRVSSKNFDFVIIQSSNSKKGVGINRYVAKDFLLESPSMKTGFEKYAASACLAKFNSQSATPNLGSFSIIRHKLTPECKGQRISLAEESCIQSCRHLTE